MLSWLYSSWLVTVHTILIGPPHCPPPHVSYKVLIGHWSPNVILVIQFSLVPISLVPQCEPGHTALIGSPSHWPPMRPWLYLSHWSPNVNPGYTVLSPHLIGPPLVIHLIAPVSLFPQCNLWLYSSHCSPISLVTQCNPGYTVLPHLIGTQCNPTVLIGPPSHWLPNVALVIQFSLVPHLTGYPM